MTSTLSIPRVAGPPGLWHDYLTPPSFENDNEVDEVPIFTITGARTLPTIPFAPSWSIPPTLQPKHAFRLPFLTRVTEMDIRAWLKLSDLFTRVRGSHNPWRFDAMFGGEEKSKCRQAFNKFIDKNMPPMLYEPEHACARCRYAFGTTVNGRRIPCCYFFTTDDPLQDEDGEWTVSARCIGCIAYGQDCNIKIGPATGLPTRFIIDPAPGQPTFVQLGDSDDSSEEDGGDQGDTSAVENNFKEADGEGSQRAGKRKRVSIHEEGVTLQSSVGGRATELDAFIDTAGTAHGSGSSDDLSVAERQGLVAITKRLQQSHDQARRVVELEAREKDVSGRLASAEQENVELKQQLDQYKAQVEQQKTQLESLAMEREEITVVPMGSKEEPISPHRRGLESESNDNAAMPIADPCPNRTDKQIPMWLEQDIDTSLQPGEILVGQSCGIFIDKWDKRLKLVGSFEKKGWRDIVDDPKTKAHVWAKFRDEGDW